MAEVHLPTPTARYDELQQRQIHEVIEREFSDRLARFDDIEVSPKTVAGQEFFLGNRIILTSPDGTRYELTVEDGGALVANPL